VRLLRIIHRFIIILGNVDLFTAGLVETKVPGGAVGPTFACLIEKQFRRIKEGDRFFLTNEGEFGDTSKTYSLYL